MKWINKPPVNLSKVTVRGGLPTMPVGKYHGVFVGATIDADGKQWVTVTTSNAAHLEQSDIDISMIAPMSDVEFVIEAAGGAFAIMKGNQYKLLGPDGEDELTDWLSMADLYTYIKSNNIVLAEPKLKEITPR